MRSALAGSILDTFIGVLIMSVVAVAASSFVPGLSRQTKMTRIAGASGQQKPSTPKVTSPSSGPTVKIGLDKSGTGLSLSRTATLIMYVQSALIVVLLAGLSSEYQANFFMQQWISQNAAPLGYLLSDYSGAALVAIVAVAGLIIQGLGRRRKFRVSELST